MYKKSIKSKLTGAEVLLKSFQDSGVELMLGYTGGTIMPVLDKIKDFPDMRFITCRNEQGAGFIAQGYTRAKGKIAPVLVTSGPGVTNTVTAVADAMMDSVPMLVVSGQVVQEAIGTDAFQETDVVGLMYPITKYAVLPDSVDEIAKTVGQMFYIAKHGRPGPTCIDLAKNLQFETTEKIYIPNKLDLPGLVTIQEVDSNSQSITEAISLIKKSKRPVVLLGHGAILSNAQKEIIDFIETTNTPTALTLHALSAIPFNHPLCLGMMGMHGEIQANKAIEDADLLIALGMRFDDRVTGKLSVYAKNAKVIHIEVDPSEIDKNVQTDIQINADLKDALQAINQNLKKEFPAPPVREEFFQEIESNKNLSQKYYSHIFEKGVGKSGKLLMSKIINDLSEYTQGQANIVTDVGQHQMQTAKFYQFNRFNTFFSSGGLGTMGFGIPTGIGVKLARPEEQV